MEFDITVYHLPGKDNIVADALSRNPVDDPDLVDNEPRNPIKFAEILTIEETARDYEDFLVDIIQFLHEMEYPVEMDAKHKLRNQAKRFFLIPQVSGITLFCQGKDYRLRRVIPKCSRAHKL
jgi:hypothetical protein